MKLLALSVGHGPSRDRGAENDNGTTELDWNRDLAVRIVRELRVLPRGDLHVTVVPRSVEKVPPVLAVNAMKADFAVELHLNAYNKTATGTEMLHWHNSVKGKALAQTLLDAAVSVLSLPNRGLKSIASGERGGMFLARTRCPACIVESFFIDNDEDLAVGNEKKDELARAYADAFTKFAATLI